jgi:hypothetical protein
VADRRLRVLYVCLLILLGGRSVTVLIGSYRDAPRSRKTATGLVSGMPLSSLDGTHRASMISRLSSRN